MYRLVSKISYTYYIMDKLNRTCDINLAAFLVTKNYKLIKIEADGQENRCYFVFENISEELINSYYNNAEVPAKLLLANQKDLKTRIYTFLRK